MGAQKHHAGSFMVHLVQTIQRHIFVQIDMKNIFLENLDQAGLIENSVDLCRDRRNSYNTESFDY